MRKRYHTILKKVFCKNVKSSRFMQGLNQSAMSEKLLMDYRSYSDIERGINSCSAVTLMLYLIYSCQDVDLFLEETKSAFERDLDDVNL